VVAIFRLIFANSGHRIGDFGSDMYSMGLLEATVAALRTHQQDKELQGCGIGLLGYAATSPDNAKAKYLVEEFSAHEDIIAAMKAFPDDYNLIQREGCAALVSLLDQGAAFEDQDAAFYTICKSVGNHDNSGHRLRGKRLIRKLLPLIS